MNWSMERQTHYSAEHLHKPNKRQLGQNVEKDFLPLQKGEQFKRRIRFQH